MPHTPIALRVPPLCKHCGRLGNIHLQTTIQGEQILLKWCCAACQREWPVERKEEVTPPAA